MSVIVPVAIVNERTVTFRLAENYFNAFLFSKQFTSNLLRIKRFYLTKIFFQTFS